MKLWKDGALTEMSCRTYRHWPDWRRFVGGRLPARRPRLPQWSACSPEVPQGLTEIGETMGFPTFQPGFKPEKLPVVFLMKQYKTLYKLQTVKAPKISKGLRLKYLILNFWNIGTWKMQSDTTTWCDPVGCKRLHLRHPCSLHISDQHLSETQSRGRERSFLQSLRSLKWHPRWKVKSLGFLVQYKMYVAFLLLFVVVVDDDTSQSKNHSYSFPTLCRHATVNIHNLAKQLKAA